MMPAKVADPVMVPSRDNADDLNLKHRIMLVSIICGLLIFVAACYCKKGGRKEETEGEHVHEGGQNRERLI